MGYPSSDGRAGDLQVPSGRLQVLPTAGECSTPHEKGCAVAGRRISEGGMNALFVDWNKRLVERHYRGARTTRFFSHMRPESITRLREEIGTLASKGYFPTKQGTGWLYQKGASL